MTRGQRRTHLVLWALLAPAVVAAAVWTMRTAVAPHDEPPADLSGSTKPIGAEAAFEPAGEV